MKPYLILTLCLLMSQSLWAMNYENLERCFTGTNWGGRLDSSVTSSPTSRFFNHMQLTSGSGTHFDPRLLVVPVVRPNYTDIHLIQYSESRNWLGQRRVDFAPKTLRVSNSQLTNDCTNNTSVVSIGGNCTMGSSQRCPMANLSIGVSSPQTGSRICAQVTRNALRLDSRTQAQERPLTPGDAQVIARNAVIERLNFVRDQITAGALTGVESNVTYAASGPCLNIFSGSENTEVVAAAVRTLCAASPTHSQCILGDTPQDMPRPESDTQF
jgi:hypothetical protein